MRSLHETDFPHIFLKPGELFVSRDPAIVSTVLGSCVSITIYSPAGNFGAMCHALLPTGNIADGFKYVDSTLLYLADKIRAQGLAPCSCEVKLFGGADVLLPRTETGMRLSIGQQNIASAYEIFEKLSIVPKSVDTGGVHGRKLFFNSRNGDVFVKKVQKTIYTPPLP